MFKTYLLVACLIFLGSKTHAQRLDLEDVVKIYVAMDIEPGKALPTITRELRSRATGWSQPVITHPDGSYMATWTYKVGAATNGIFRFMVQTINDKAVAKITYECPYERLFDDYVTDLKANGAELVDSSNEDDGGINNVYQYKSYIFILGKWPKELGRTFAGVPTGYVKVLLHHAVN